MGEAHTVRRKLGSLLYKGKERPLSCKLFTLKTTLFTLLLVSPFMFLLSPVSYQELRGTFKSSFTESTQSKERYNAQIPIKWTEVASLLESLKVKSTEVFKIGLVNFNKREDVQGWEKLVGERHSTEQGILMSSPEAPKVEDKAISSPLEAVEAHVTVPGSSLHVKQEVTSTVILVSNPEESFGVACASGKMEALVDTDKAEAWHAGVDAVIMVEASTQAGSNKHHTDVDTKSLPGETNKSEPVAMNDVKKNDVVGKEEWLLDIQALKLYQWMLLMELKNFVN